jgi:phospholipid-binding lipoprotein MlaA
MKLESLAARASRAGAAIAIAFALGGCAMTTEARNPRDPWEPFNRHADTFNEALDKVILKPAATWYRDKVPPLARTGVSNFFGNMSDAWSAVNSLLQFRLQDFEESLARVQLNTIFGVFGIFDVASDFNIERHREDFGQTLGRWGVPAGPYLVLPFFGPSTLRDGTALIADFRWDPVHHIGDDTTRYLTYYTRAVDRRSNLLTVSSVLESAALDRYSFTRDAYLQRRRAQIDDRQDNPEVPPPLPDESQEPPAGQPVAPPAR